MLEATDIIKGPLVTEKTTWESDDVEAGGRHRYSFRVDLHANKPQIRAAIEKIYGVRVESVATQIRKGPSFKNRYGVGKKPDWKKATVHIHPEDKIELF